nr:RNA-directed DNA polymerase, eukaryota, reverse transcriptase zinc-binding domain protein [Tanacetum cinerariifolium]
MGSMRSKEDEVLKIATSVFIANFPDHFITKDLWNTYKQYGSVVDAFILNRRSKAGKKPMNIEMENNPALVLDNSCLNQQGYSNFLMGKVKDFASLTNLKVVLVKDGYENIKLKYMGGYWVMIEFQSQEAKKRFQSNVGIGKVFWVWAKEIPRWVPNFMEDNDEETDTDEDTNEGESNGEDVGLKNFSTWEGDSDEEAVPDTKFKEEISKTNVEEVSMWQKDAHSMDPFNLYDLFNKKQDENNKGHSVDDSLKYPLGYTPIDKKDASDEHSNKSNESKRASGECFQSTQEEKKGVWVPNGKKLLIISVYAPKELNEKKTWDYISHVISNWKGDVVIMGDFNEVRKKAKRFGSVFNVQGADAFNLFISNAGLDEVPLVIDKGEGDDDVVNKRTNVVRFLQELEKFQSQILDGPFILNELLQWCKSKKKHSLVFKVDFEKAYDSVRWDYLDDNLRKFGFGEKWVIRFLFILFMESLYVSFQRVVDTGMFKDITLGSSLHRSHMFYADDAIFMARKIVCVTLKTPFSYLRSKVGGLMSRVQSWNETQGYGCSFIKMEDEDSRLEDAWRGDIAFKCLYPRVYTLELCTSIDVASKMAQSNLGHSFRRGPRGGEEHAQFDLMLERWRIRRLVEDYMLAEVTSKTHWMKAVPIMVNVLAWKVKLDCLTIRLNISHR